MLSSDNTDGMILKFESVEASNAVVKKARDIGGDKREKIKVSVATSDGGYIVGGSITSKSIDLENGINIEGPDNTIEYGILIKYNKNEECEWVKVLKGSDVNITSIVECKDKSYIVGGEVDGYTLDAGNGKKINNLSGDSGFLIKYTNIGNCEWAKAFKGWRF